MAQALSIFALIIALSASTAVQAQQEQDGLVRVQARGFDETYLAPGANLSGYSKVMLEPAEVSFTRNWVRDYNNNVPGLEERISDEEAQAMLDAVQEGLQDVFAEEYASSGYEIVTSPGPGVLRVRPGIIDLEISAPDLMSSVRAHRFAREAGEATLVLEARDAVSGALLVRAIDEREVGDETFMVRRTSVSNRADFRRTFRTWARNSVRTLEQWRDTPPAAIG